METSTLDNELDIFEQNWLQGAEDDDEYESDCEFYGKSAPTKTVLEHVDLRSYIREKCENKIQIVDPATFATIKKPILIHFNHFNVYCAYQTKWLDIIYQLTLKYGDRIEFLVGDLMDTTVLNESWDPLKFFCPSDDPKNENPITFAIDEKKQTIEFRDGYKTLENFSNVCDKLLDGSLYPSKPLPADNAERQIKICNVENYAKLVTNCQRDVFLIEDMGECPTENGLRYEANYNEVALQMRDYNLDIVYIDHLYSYIPFESITSHYPKCTFIPHHDKCNHIEYNKHEPRTTENIVRFLKQCYKNPEKLKSILSFEPLPIEKLPEHLEKYYKNRIKILQYDLLGWSKKGRFPIITVMAFDALVSTQQLKLIHGMYRIDELCYQLCDFFVCDIKNIKYIHQKLTKEDISEEISNPAEPLCFSHNNPHILKVYALDCYGRFYNLPKYKDAATLCYLTFYHRNLKFYRSQPRPRAKNDYQNTCVAINWDLIMTNARKAKKSIFLCIFESEVENSNEILLKLRDFSKEVKALKLPLRVVKFDASLNSLALKYYSNKYPIGYLIFHEENKPFAEYSGSWTTQDMLKFVRENIM